MNSSLRDVKSIELWIATRSSSEEPFIESLSSYYTSGIGELTDLYIILPYQLEEPENSVKAIESLLKVCPKLEDLQLDLSRHGFVAKECILAHCQTLECLMLGTGKSKICSHFTVTEMTAVLRACIHLKYLAVNMPACDLGTITELGTGFHPKEEFADMLAVVSTHPVLNAFRILNLPTVNFGDVYETESVPMNEQVYSCQALMQDYANKILRFMAGRGSKLRVLIIKPSSEVLNADGDPYDVDLNGHQWPEYHYARGHLEDFTGMKGVVAHPLRDALLDFPDLGPLLN
ncbi:uncharacterized protein J4E78_009401 [Alternaria triticimaculans]|uniref:uncharacterized protein n=1 Tax=Alternaria triticimaculans TaxID=297637 RepID=UPI0020C592D6|nr:uncharacterized protein J4E78_009401 [Alternaria triticimaculans]KAI4645489.1 hypothetical protein J4E78_009401 [Alternaria triticimaculans]